MQIILNHPHTHAGIDYVAGAELDVSRRDAEWLVMAGVANFKPGVHKRADTDTAATHGDHPPVSPPTHGFARLLENFLPTNPETPDNE